MTNNYTINKTVKQKVNISANDLPIYKIYFGYNTTWYFRLKVIEGYLVAHKLEINTKGGHQYLTTIPEIIIDGDYDKCTEEDWFRAVELLLKELDNQ
tara:strand:- start:24 stop:314 length:291 start_codon:yes stop_codon:yes gene_type:complete